jgi:hypothetical protein
MNSNSSVPQNDKITKKRGVLDWIEWGGNKLPDPSIFIYATSAERDNHISCWQRGRLERTTR